MLRFMNMKLKCLFFLMAVVTFFSVTAQRKIFTDTYATPTDITMYGKLKYSYVVDENGENVKDGPLSVSAAIKNQKTVVQYRMITLNANYTLNASYNKGKLNGPMKMLSKFVATGSGISETDTYSFSGSFSNSYPNGLFNVLYKSKMKKLKASYEKGHLSGAYTVETLMNNFGYKVSGVLNHNGELNGEWNYYTTSSGKNYIYLFQNGVMLRKSSENEGYNTELSEKARLYATNKISKDSLLKLNIVVLKDSFNLGKLANSVLLDDIIDFQKFGGYDFSTSNVKYYEYLEKIPMLNNKGFNWLVNMIINEIKTGKINIGYSIMVKKDYDRWNRYLFYDESLGLEYIAGSSAGPDCEWYGYIDNVDQYELKGYLSKEQSIQLKDTILKTQKKYALDCFGYFQRKRNFDSFAYNIAKDMEIIQSGNTGNLTTGQLQNMLSAIKNYAFSDLVKTEFPGYLQDNDFLCYVNDSIYSQFNAYKAQLTNLYNAALSRDLQEAQRQKELEYERMVAKYKEKIRPTLNFLLDKKAFSIAYDENVQNYITYDGDKSDYWQLDINNRLKPFCKIVRYEIASVTPIEDTNDFEVVCVLVKKKGKKTVLHKLPLRFSAYGKLYSSSIEINSAEIF